MNGDCGKCYARTFYGSCSGKTPVSSKPFSRCSGCVLVSYCSREYQRQGWTHKDHDRQYSHRLQCKELGQLRVIWPQTDDIHHELIPELRFALHIYSAPHLSIEEIVEQIGEDAAQDAAEAAIAFPNRVRNFLDPASTQSTDEQLEELLLEKAVALDPRYYPQEMKEMANWVSGFEEFVQVYLGHFGIND